MVHMACWDSLERVFHEEFKYGIVIVIHWDPNISGPEVKGLRDLWVKIIHELNMYLFSTCREILLSCQRLRVVQRKTPWIGHSITNM